jgi:hypothetical protein
MYVFLDGLVKVIKVNVLIVNHNSYDCIYWNIINKLRYILVI